MRIAVTMLLAAVCGLLALTRAAEARVRIQVDLSSQTMQVTSDEGVFVWPISSARSGFNTPRGTYGVQRLEVMHRSRKYHNSPMPHSIFFKGGYAIHGTYDTAWLGRPASHGCIRLAPENAAVLYQLVRREGAQIAIGGTAPGTGRYYASRGSRGTRVYATAGRARGYGYGYAPADADDGQGFYMRPALGYAPQPRGLGEWLMDPGGW